MEPDPPTVAASLSTLLDGCEADEFKPGCDAEELWECPHQQPRLNAAIRAIRHCLAHAERERLNAGTCH